MLMIGNESDNGEKAQPLILTKHGLNVGDEVNPLYECTYTGDDDANSKRPSVMKTVAGFIIITEFCERLAYYGFAGSLVLLFQTQLNLSNEEADIQYSTWSSACYITPLLGGYLADTYFGRYNTIIIFCILYAFGLVLIVLGCIPGHVSASVIFPGMYIIAIGSGGIKPNVSTMGADQFDTRYPQDIREKESFFNWFYWSINLGALISYTLVSYICQFGVEGLGGVRWGFFVGYTIPAVMMILAIIVFVSGTKRYKISKPQGSVLGVAAKICFEAFWTRADVAILPGGSLLDRASEQYGGTFPTLQVESVKMVSRLLPFGLVFIPYWSVYSQMSTGFQNQGCQMDLSLGNLSVPVSALNMFDTAIILLLVPVFDGLVYPFLKKRGLPLSMLHKIGIGFLLAMLAMVAAAWVEEIRLAHSPL
eukprot:gene6536-13231_t